MARLVEGAARGPYLKRCLDGRLGWRAFFDALEWCSNRAWGKPAQAPGIQDAEPTEGKIIVEYVNARLTKHRAWPELKNRLAAVLTQSPELAEAAAAVLVEQESAEEEESAPEPDAAD